MNVQWQHVKKTAESITKQLGDLEAKINEALSRDESTLESAKYGPAKAHSSKFAKLRERVRMAQTYLKDGTQ